jgi:hypothetical protein
VRTTYLVLPSGFATLDIQLGQGLILGHLGGDAPGP